VIYWGRVTPARFKIPTMKNTITIAFLFCAMHLSAQYVTATGDTLTARCCTMSLELVPDMSKAEAKKAHKAYVKKHRRAERWIRKTILSSSK
jgi:hypothetical protein